MRPLLFLLTAFFLLVPSVAAQPTTAPAPASASGSTDSFVWGSAALELEIFRDPFSLVVRLPGTGEEVLRTAQAAFIIDGAPHAITTVRAIERGERTITLRVGLRDHLAEGRLTFRFTRPTVVTGEATLQVGVADAFQLLFRDGGDRYYGGWSFAPGRQLNLRGVRAAVAGAGPHPHLPHASARAPFYMSSRGYGVYIQSLGAGLLDLAVDGDRAGFRWEGPLVRFHLLYGPEMEALLAHYNALAGAPRMPPPWAYGVIWWRRDAHTSGDLTLDAQGRLAADAEALRRARLPGAAMVIDRPYMAGPFGWGSLAPDPGFPDLGGLLRDLDDEGLAPVLWIANRAPRETTLGQLLGGAGQLFAAYEPRWPVADLRQAEVSAVFREQLRSLAERGARGFWIGLGDTTAMPPALANELPFLFQRMAGEVLATAAPDEAYLLARSVYDGGRQHVGVIGGGPQATWEGLSASVVTGLRAGLINFPAWGSPAGGLDDLTGAPADRELYLRWLAFSAHQPLLVMPLREGSEPWDARGDDLATIRRWLDEHRRLAPYLRSMLRTATQSGLPVLRPMLLATSGSPLVADMWDQFLVGSELLVAPVLDPGATGRSVYLPEGKWLDYDRRTRGLSGDQVVRVDRGLDGIPRFVRGGGIIPRGLLARGNDDWSELRPGHLVLELFPAAGYSRSLRFFTGEIEVPIFLGLRRGVLDIEFGDLGGEGVIELHVRSFARVEQADGTPIAASAWHFDPDRNLFRYAFDGPVRLRLHDVVSLWDEPGATRPQGPDVPEAPPADTGPTPPGEAAPTPASPDAEPTSPDPVERTTPTPAPGAEG